MLISFLLSFTALASAVDYPRPDPAGGVTAWGKPLDGLQGGIRCPAGKQQLKPGEVRDLEIIVRNVTDKPIEFKYMPDGHFMAHQQDTVASVSAIYLHTGGEPRPYTAHIQPHEEMLLGQVIIGQIQPPLPPGVVGSKPSFAQFPPGKYQVGDDQVLSYFPDDKTDRKLGTGYLDLELLAE
jgi:hypothetical protein